MKKVRVVVADDNPSFLRSIVLLLAVDFDVVATASDGKWALELIHQHEPDVAILDLQMPLLNGIEVTKRLAENPSGPSVVICSVETDPEIVEAALRAGALAYVFKSRIEKELILAVKSAFQGEPFASASSR